MNLRRLAKRQMRLAASRTTHTYEYWGDGLVRGLYTTYIKWSILKRPWPSGLNKPKGVK